MEPRTPPRYVPTLTRVVETGTDNRNLRPAAAPASVARAGTRHTEHRTPAAADATQTSSSADAMSSRIMQRVELTLDRHLREATTQAALELSRNMAQQMRPIIEAAVRNAVREALNAERSR